MPERIQRKRTKGWKMPPNTVCVTRPGPFGNPFTPGKDGPMGRKPLDKEGAVGFFRAMLRDPELRAAAGYPSDDVIRRRLSGKNLACFCGLDEKCHADVLLELANATETPPPPDRAARG
jgi:hypothetical protein